MILWNDDAHAGDVRVSAMIHDNGTHSLTFQRYPGLSEVSRFIDVGFHFTAADIDAVAALLERMKGAREIKPAPSEPRVCEFCGKPATDERPDRDGRVMSVCDFCAEDHDRAAKRDREEAAREAAVDMALSEWKENRGRR